jgi:tRNA-specific 2-thiouridylase
LCDKELYKKSLSAQNINWISGSEPKLPLNCLAKIRYGHEAVTVEVRSQKSLIVKQLQGVGRLVGEVKGYEVIFKTSQRAITSGQSIVFYKRNEVLGGGVIVN